MLDLAESLRGFSVIFLMNGTRVRLKKKEVSIANAYMAQKDCVPFLIALNGVLKGTRILYKPMGFFQVKVPSC